MIARRWHRRSAVLAVAALLSASFARPAAQEVMPPDADGDPPADRSYYRSNADFILLSELPPTTDPSGTAGWVIEQRRSTVGGRRVDATLYRDGSIVGSEREEFRPDGLPRLVERRDAAGELLFRETYAYRDDGTLRTVERCDGDGGCTTARYGAVHGPGEEIIRSPTHQLTLRYDAAARPAYILRVEPDGTREEEWLTWEAGALVERRVLSGRDELVERFRDGRRVSLVRRRGGRAVEQIDSRYDAEGRLIEEVTEREGERIVEEYRYDPDGAVRLVRRVDGRLRLVEERDGQGNRITTRFLDGRPVLRETYRNGSLVRRETLRDGEVVTSETFGSASAPRPIPADRGGADSGETAEADS